MPFNMREQAAAPRLLSAFLDPKTGQKAADTDVKKLRKLGVEGDIEMRITANDKGELLAHLHGQASVDAASGKTRAELAAAEKAKRAPAKAA